MRCCTRSSLVRSQHHRTVGSDFPRYRWRGCTPGLGATHPRCSGARGRAVHSAPRATTLPATNPRTEAGTPSSTVQDRPGCLTTVIMMGHSLDIMASIKTSAEWVASWVRSLWRDTWGPRTLAWHRKTLTDSHVKPTTEGGTREREGSGPSAGRNRLAWRTGWGRSGLSRAGSTAGSWMGWERERETRPYQPGKTSPKRAASRDFPAVGSSGRHAKLRGVQQESYHKRRDKTDERDSERTTATRSGAFDCWW